MESIAKTYLPKTTTMPVGAQMEIQINNVGYLYQCVSNDAPCCKWQLIETNQINGIEEEKRGRGRPRKVPQAQPVVIAESKTNSYAVYTAAEIQQIEKLSKTDKSEGLRFNHNEEIDRVQYPVFNKVKK